MFFLLFDFTKGILLSQLESSVSRQFIFKVVCHFEQVALTIRYWACGVELCGEQKHRGSVNSVVYFHREMFLRVFFFLSYMVGK